VEVVPFAWHATARRLQCLGAHLVATNDTRGTSVHHRWRPSHPGLCVWNDRRSRASATPTGRNGRRRRPRPIPWDGVSGHRRWLTGRPCAQSTRYD
jgi:hypothetical protein